jgi:hypothetical protein
MAGSVARLPDAVHATARALVARRLARLAFMVLTALTIFQAALVWQVHRRPPMQVMVTETTLVRPLAVKETR